MKQKDVNLGSVFDYVEIHSTYLEQLVRQVVATIGDQVDFDEVSLGALHEGLTSSGEAGEVTEDGDIYLDSDKLRKYDDDVASAIIAHELAHRVLEHHEGPGGLESENEADELARKWGFDVDKFRRVCGSATHGGRTP